MARSNYFREIRPRYQYGLRQAAARQAIARNINPDAWIKDIGSLAKTIQAARAQTGQDAIARQIMNTQMAPRAQLVTNAANQGLRINPKTAQAVTVGGLPGLSGVPTGFNIPKSLQQLGTAGTQPFGWSGGKEQSNVGMADLQAKAEAQKLVNQIDPVGAAVAKARGQAAAGAITGAGGGRGVSGRIRGGGGGGGTTGGGRQAAAPKAPSAAQIKAQQAADDLNYQPNSETNPANYTRAKMQKDFDHVYGDKAFDTIYPNLNHIQPWDGKTPPVQQGVDKSGKPTTVAATGLFQDPQGNLTYFENGTSKYNVGVNDIANTWQGKFNSFRRNAGLEPLNLVPLQGGASAGWTGKKDAQGNPVDDQGNPIPGLNANVPVGDPRNPAMPKTAFDIASVPNGSDYIDPRDGLRKTKQDPQAVEAAQQSQGRAAQLAQLHAYERPGAEPSYDEFEDPESQKRIAAAEALRNYDVSESPEDQARIDEIAARQAQAGPQPSDFYRGSPATTGVTVTGAGGPPNPSDYYAGSPALQPSAAPNPSDLYAGSPGLPASYLDVGAQPAVAPPQSPNVTGQAAAQAAVPVFEPVTNEYVSPTQPLPVASYLGGY